MTEAELLRRLDRTIERNSQVIELNGRAFQQLVRSQQSVERKLDDLRDHVGALTEAILSLIDRLGPAADAG